MKSTMKIRIPVALILSVVLLTAAGTSWAQTATRFVGTVTAVNGTSLSVKTDAGEIKQVAVPSEAAIKRISPGQKDLSTAETIQFSDLATGDRVLVKLDPDAPAGSAQALQVIAVKQADVMLKQQKDRDDWQKRGTGGLVKSIDAANGTIVVTTGSGATAKTVAVHTTKSTMLKRYAPASVSFDAAKPAPMDAIHVGDQLRARGTKNSDGTEIAAEEVISGSFRNLSGLIASLDAAAATVTIKDLATKKAVTIHVPADAQLRKIPERMAQMLAVRLQGGAAASVPSQRTGGVQGGGQWAGSGSSGGDLQQFLTRAPAVQLADLKTGDAIMVVSTDGATEVTAITLLAGVEPLLQAPAAQNLLSAWSMGGGGGAEASAQ
jgi:hypothetical protein